MDLITQLGFVQVDSVRTVERAHHMILFSRNQTYKPTLLTQSLEQHRHLFEHWTHDAAVIPVEFYRYWRQRMRRNAKKLQAWLTQHHGEGLGEELASVLSHVRQHGEVMARDLKKTSAGSSQGWWQWHPSKTALEYLWRDGKLAVARRQGFQKVYDLTKRVIPAPHATSIASSQEYIDWSCRTALERLGCATPGEIAAFWDGVSIAEVKSWIAKQPADVLVDVNVESVDQSRPRRAVGFVNMLAQLQDLPAVPTRMRVLSPFDPLIRDRKRCLRLFGFDYRIEIFVPANKRRYGYYVFPLLHKDQLVGRIDIKADRQSSRLQVDGLWWESHCRVTRTRKAALESELDRLRRYVGLDSVHFAKPAATAMRFGSATVS